MNPLWFSERVGNTGKPPETRDRRQKRPVPEPRTQVGQEEGHGVDCGHGRQHSPNPASGPWAEEEAGRETHEIRHIITCGYSIPATAPPSCKQNPKAFLGEIKKDLNKSQGAGVGGGKASRGVGSLTEVEVQDCPARSGVPGDSSGSGSAPRRQCLQARKQSTLPKPETEREPSQCLTVSRSGPLPSLSGRITMISL